MMMMMMMMLMMLMMMKDDDEGDKDVDIGESRFPSYSSSLYVINIMEKLHSHRSDVDCVNFPISTFPSTLVVLESDDLTTNILRSDLLETTMVLL